jgi:hypothetical protein
LGESCARCFKQPTRNEYVGGSSASALELTGVPQSGQNECLRFAPLSEILT